MTVSTGHSQSPSSVEFPDVEPPTSLLRNRSLFIVPAILLTIVYSLLGLTLTHNLSHAHLMQRCVLADPKMARIWSVGNVEIGLSYFGVFGGMVWYFLRAYRKSVTHLVDLAYAVAYLVGSFILDYSCVKAFQPFWAMFIGDALVMTFTLAVSRQLWFQRLLGVFIPLIFLTCALGHFLEGLSYWATTFPVNVPWTMVTADIGFAVLVNSSRFPAFIRGEDVVNELSVERERTEDLQRQIDARTAAEAENAQLHAEIQVTAERQRLFLKDVLASVTEGRLHYCSTREELPSPNASESPYRQFLNRENLGDLRAAVRSAGDAAWLPPSRLADIVMATGEAAMNAVVHGEAGNAAVYTDRTRNRVQIWIEDHGHGISLASLPRATLEPGYTTSGTLGHGFWMMLKTADRVYLMTGPEGTTVVLEQGQKAQDEAAWISKRMRAEEE